MLWLLLNQNKYKYFILWLSLCYFFYLFINSCCISGLTCLVVRFFWRSSISEFRTVYYSVQTHEKMQLAVPRFNNDVLGMQLGGTDSIPRKYQKKKHCKKISEVIYYTLLFLTNNFRLNSVLDYSYLILSSGSSSFAPRLDELWWQVYIYSYADTVNQIY